MEDQESHNSHELDFCALSAVPGGDVAMVYDPSKNDPPVGQHNGNMEDRETYANDGFDDRSDFSMFESESSTASQEVIQVAPVSVKPATNDPPAGQNKGNIGTWESCASDAFDDQTDVSMSESEFSATSQEIIEVTSASVSRPDSHEETNSLCAGSGSNNQVDTVLSESAVITSTQEATDGLRISESSDKSYEVEGQRDHADDLEGFLESTTPEGIHSTDTQEAQEAAGEQTITNFQCIGLRESRGSRDDDDLEGCCISSMCEARSTTKTHEDEKESPKSIAQPTSPEDIKDNDASYDLEDRPKAGTSELNVDRLASILFSNPQILEECIVQNRRQVSRGRMFGVVPSTFTSGDSDERQNTNWYEHLGPYNPDCVQNLLLARNYPGQMLQPTLFLSLFDNTISALICAWDLVESGHTKLDFVYVDVVKMRQGSFYKVQKLAELLHLGSPLVHDRRHEYLWSGSRNVIFRRHPLSEAVLTMEKDGTADRDLLEKIIARMEPEEMYQVNGEDFDNKHTEDQHGHNEQREIDTEDLLILRLAHILKGICKDHAQITTNPESRKL